jgi:hypothetical protein
MRTVTINGYDCIFDDDADTRGLCVSITPAKYKGLRYNGGYYKGKYYSRIYMKAPAHLQVDHINGDRLDNRKVNLRLVTRQQNMANQAVSKTKKSGLPKGVYKGKNNKYDARLTYKGTQYCLGSFTVIKEAETAYKKKAEQLQGEYAAHLSRP